MRMSGGGARTQTAREARGGGAWMWTWCASVLVSEEVVLCISRGSRRPTLRWLGLASDDHVFECHEDMAGGCNSGMRSGERGRRWPTWGAGDGRVGGMPEV